MKPIEYRDASPEVRAVFDDIKTTRKVEDVNKFWKYLANEPRMLAHLWGSLKDMMGSGALDPLTKELVYIAVSITNNCPYCIAYYGYFTASHNIVCAVTKNKPGIYRRPNCTNCCARDKHHTNCNN